MAMGSKKNILMLDVNPEVDRREVLEAKALKKAGYNVMLLTLSQDETYSEIIDGLPVLHVAAAACQCKKCGCNKFHFPINPFPLTEWISLIGQSSVTGEHITKLVTKHAPHTADKNFISINLKSTHLASFYAANPLDAGEAQIFSTAMYMSEVHAIHMNDMPTLKPGILLSKQFGVPAVYDAHELFPYQTYVSRHANKIFEIESRLIQHCDRVVVINEQQADVMREDYGYNKFVPFTNATERPDDLDLKKKYSLIRDRVAIPENHKIMIFMGGISFLRKTDQLLRGMALARKDVHMVFLTRSPNEEIEALIRLAHELGILSRVHVLDPVPWSEIVYWCASADVGVMPYQAMDMNTRLSCPNKMYEFIAAATPMIGSNELVNVKKIVGENDFGVLMPLHGPADYADLINAIFDEKGKGLEHYRDNIIKKGDQYLVDNEIGAFMKMYAEILPL